LCVYKGRKKTLSGGTIAQEKETFSVAFEEPINGVILEDDLGFVITKCSPILTTFQLY
jgi:hypothetical protein